MKKILLLIAGNIALSLGIAGVFLPVLPTTPFLLLSAACYMRGSDRMYRWLINHKLLGLYIRSYVKYKAVSKRAKIISISMLWIVITISAVFFIDIMWVRILLFFIAVGVTLYLIHIKTLTSEMLEEDSMPQQL